MRLLDLFCGAGGAAVGYARAGFDVVGVDINPQPHYPFEFVQCDAFAFLGAIEDVDNMTFDVIHASPPCHDHSTVTGRNRKAQGVKGTGWMLEATIKRLAHIGVPWVVENVEGARMPATFRLCGSSFGLDVRRHRLFASSFLMLPPPCDHTWQTPRFRSLDNRRRKNALASVVGVHGHLNYPGDFELRKRAMDIEWMTNAELGQAIPPAYTEWIGRQLIAALRGGGVSDGLLQGPEKGTCGCGCDAFGTLRKAWRSSGIRCVRGCVCRQCIGKRSRSRGDSEARVMRKKLGLTGANTRHEELWRGPLRVEAKAGARDAGPVIVRYRASKRQSDASKALGDLRPFVALFSFDGERLAVLTVDDLAAILDAVA